MFSNDDRVHYLMEQVGMVYKAQDIKLKRTVAIKFLPRDLTRDPDAKERFVQEAQTAAALNRADIVTTYEIVKFESPETVDRQIFISMEYVAGKTLQEL